jgi:hypothetical protein
MGSAASSTLRTPLLLLAAANLGVLGMRLWPWPEIMNLPGNGTVGFDPAIILIVYMGLIYWINSGAKPPFLKALSMAALMGLPAGLLLAAYVYLEVQPSVHPPILQPGLLVAAAVFCAVGGLRGSKAEGNAGMGMICGTWSAMVGSLIGCGAVLAAMYMAGAPPEVQDPWKQYQGLAIGNTETQALVHSLNMATEFLLMGPLVGGVLGLVFAFFGQSQKG